MRRVPRRLLIAGLSLAGLVLALRAALPFALERVIERKLESLDGYGGEIGDVDLSLLRGAYEIEGLEIVKTRDGRREPFFKARKVDLSIQWKQLANGALVGELNATAPELNMIAGSPYETPKEDGRRKPWTATVRELFPVRINRVRVENGAIHYRDPHGSPDVDVYAKDVRITATNLTNSEKVSDDLAANIDARARLQDGAPMTLSGSIDPFEEEPTFDLDFRLERLDVTRLNRVFRHYAGIDVESGTFALYLEMAAADGKFDGYAKPFLENVDVVDLKKEDLPLGRKIKEGVADAVANVLENEKQDTVATKIPFSGTFGEADVDVLSSVLAAFRHAFVSAIRPDLADRLDIEI